MQNDSSYVRPRKLSDPTFENEAFLNTYESKMAK